MHNSKELAKIYASLDPEAQRVFQHFLLNPSELADEKPADPWQPFTLVDAYQERQPVQYIAGRLFALPSLNIVYGAPGTYKSFLLADLLVCTTLGLDWLPPAQWLHGIASKGIATQQARVMWCDFDNGRRRTHDRFGALGRANNVPVSNSNLVYYSMPNPWLNANDKASIGSLALRMRDNGTQMLVIDNLGVVSGDAEENSGEMAGVMSGFRQLAEDTNAAVILIHHQRKSNGAIGRAGDTLRGHSSIEASLDLALLVEREELASKIAIKATKVRGEDVLPFSAVFTYELFPNGELKAAKFFGANADDQKSDNAIDREIYTVLENQSVINKTNLVTAVKELLPDIGINRIRERIEYLESMKKIAVIAGEKSTTERLFSKI
jgi:hypothetical protein